MSASIPVTARRWRFFGLPLYLRVLIGLAAGILLGVVFGTRPIVFGLRNDDLGQLGFLVIRLLKALAVPLILFAILDAFLKVQISARAGGRLVFICLCNVSVAFAIGLTLMNTLRPGTHWRGRLNEIAGIVQHDAGLASAPTPETSKVTLDPIKNIAGYVPESLVDPFAHNNVITVVLLGLLGGAALRRVKTGEDHAGHSERFAPVENLIAGLYQMLIQMLAWVVEAVPFAVFGVVAQVVGRSGLGVFHALGNFLFVILLGLILHSLIYYPLVAWFVGKKSPRVYLGGGADAILTGISCNSSLATVPVTLRCLTEKMGVSDASARLAACVGTNLNNDGITLYEAMAALFLAQAYGFDLTLGQQAVVVLASLMAGIGVAGVPEAGLIVLPLVLAAAGLPEKLIVVALPLILPVDWIIARARSGVNVMSDMLVAILLDRGVAKPDRARDGVG
ncbi:MAG: dicarboxylate/amino acid:cation symporter [Chthoniobacterales bacterium]